MYFNTTLVETYVDIYFDTYVDTCLNTYVYTYLDTYVDLVKTDFVSNFRRNRQQASGHQPKPLKTFKNL